MKFLVVRFSSIGDVVLTTPVVRCLKQQMPDAEIHFLTKKSFRSVLEQNPYIDELICIEKSIDEVVNQLQNNKYDFIIDLHHNIRTFRLKRSLRKPSAAFPKLNISKFLLTKFHINRLPKIHVVDRYFETVKRFGVVPDGKPADFFLTESDELNLSTLNIKQNQFLCVAMGAQFATKQLPISLMQQVLKDFDASIVLLGGESDRDRANALIQALPNQQISSFCGQISLRQSAFLLSQSKAVLTGDTGLMHIASCFQKPIVSVWGNTVPDFGMYAYYPKQAQLLSIHEVQGLSCRPCSKIGYQACPKKHFNCMNLQDDQAIRNQLNKLFAC